MTTSMPTSGVIKFDTPGLVQQDGKSMGFEEAVALLHRYEKRIQKADQLRIPKEPTGTQYDLEFYTLVKSMGISVALIAPGLMAEHSPGTIDDMLIFPIMAGTLIVTMSSLLGFEMKPMLKFLSPIRAKKIAQEEILVKALHEIKEAGFSKTESKVLSKAQDAIAVINNELRKENKEIIYSRNTKYCRAGFRVREHRDGEHIDRILDVALKIPQIEIASTVDTPVALEPASMKQKVYGKIKEARTEHNTFIGG